MIRCTCERPDEPILLAAGSEHFGASGIELEALLSPPLLNLPVTLHESLGGGSPLPNPRSRSEPPHVVCRVRAMLLDPKVPSLRPWTMCLEVG